MRLLGESGLLSSDGATDRLLSSSDHAAGDGATGRLLLSDRSSDRPAGNGAGGLLLSDRVADFGLGFGDCDDVEEPASGPFSFDLAGTLAILVLDCSTICLKMKLQAKNCETRHNNAGGECSAVMFGTCDCQEAKQACLAWLCLVSRRQNVSVTLELC